MNAVLALAYVKRERFEINDRFRLAGDSIFLLPLLYVLIET